ncbi:hypothetical protein ACI6PS_02540 [Flavobacterium sp. PLA-1-15]|uniref:hypothetical protein n=1 Tax=Flavobacterium sp. PLA-1-15 TaxID=3380533 RepID=UPI003B7D5932
MSRKTSVDKNDKRIEKRFATWIKMAIDLIAPKFLWLVAGRATSKTSDIIAERFIDVCHDMPGAYLAFVSDTYVNALKNIVPALIEGLERKGWIEGIHYVVDKAPPSHFAKPYKPPQSYKHTISVFNGCFVNLISMDQPSGSAGNSYQHIFGDETKYLDFDKVKKLTPALRGYKKFAKSVFYRGMTFTTDMPNIADGEYDWILDREKDMDLEQIRLALRAGFVLNELRIEMMNEQKAGDTKKVRNLQKQIERWEKRWEKARKNSTFFKIVSSYVNVDFLTEDYFADSYMALGPEEFKTAIGSFQPTLKKGDKFYINLGDHHFYENGINTEFYKRYAIGEAVKESSLAQRYIDNFRAIECGVDFGNMCSMVTGQDQGDSVYLFKNFYTLPPESTKELAKQFLDFYEHHPTKTLEMYFDRSGNNYAEIRKDWATELQSHIEYYEGVSTGWTVNLKSKGQQNIYQEEEYNLMKNLLAGDNPELPNVKICQFGCRELKSSMGVAKTLVKTDKDGNKKIHKDKTSEKIPKARLPMFSTNMSDAGKYFFFRPGWVKISSKRKKRTSSTAPEGI